MEISFLVTAYKFDKYISQCIQSILSQNINVEYEILVRDDHSGDKTNEILENTFGHIETLSIIKSESNLGAYENLKLLISLSKGKYIFHLDGDDYLTNTDRVMSQYNFLESNLDFSMVCSGYRTEDSDGNLSIHNHPLMDIVTEEDMINNNWVTFGRMWRREATQTPKWLSKMPYLDWVFNYMISKSGKIKCDYNEGGIYRVTDDGMFSKKPRSEKRINYLSTSQALCNLHNLERKVITITDCFVRNEQIENKLILALKKIRDLNNDILLISNTTVSKEIMSLCDFFLYDKRNQLFTKEYENIEPVDFYISTGDFVIHNVVDGMQRHGLSVLINLYNSVSHAKTLGYKYFQRIECDDIFGPESITRMRELQDECIALNKKGLFYVNENEANISFHYFFCEIDHFLNVIHQISNEEDYENYVNSRSPIPKFMIAEEFIYEGIISSLNDLHIKKGNEMDGDFPDTQWNTETSDSNMGTKYNGCITGIYGSDRGDIICSYNYATEGRNRKIEVFFKNGETQTIYHNLEVRGSWTYHQFGDIEKIEVYEGADYIYTQNRLDTESYIDFN